MKKKPLRFWWDDLTWSGKGRGKVIEPSMTNAALVLANVDELDGSIAWNEMAGRAEFLLPPPTPAALSPAGGAQPGPIDEDACARLAAWLETHPDYPLKLSDELVYKACRLVAKRKPFHPIQGWLFERAREWDGVKRLDTWLTEFLGVEDSPYARRVGRFFLVQAVARAMKPGVKADFVLVIEGAQGAGKSTAAEVLFNERWFTDAAIDLSNKDAYLSIRGKWCVELAELESLSRVSENRAKAFFSQRNDRYREPYAKHVIEVPRTCVFVATTNQHEYLRDDTGNRRYWPVRARKVDLTALGALRGQLFGEAKRAFDAGEQWWPSKEEETLFAHQADQRRALDPWYEPVASWLSDKTERVTTHQVLTGALRMRSASINRAHETRVGSIMRELGWKSARPRTDNPDRLRFYEPPAGEEVGPVGPGESCEFPVRSNGPTRSNTFDKVSETSLQDCSTPLDRLDRLDRIEENQEESGPTPSETRLDQVGPGERPENIEDPFRECFERSSGDSELFRDVASAWQFWCKKGGTDPRTEAWLATALAEQGYTFAGYRVVGLRLLTTDELASRRAQAGDSSTPPEENDASENRSRNEAGEGGDSGDHVSGSFYTHAHIETNAECGPHAPHYPRTALDEVLARCFEVAASGRVSFQAIVAAWEAHCRAEGLEVGHESWLSNELAERGFSFAGYLVVGLRSRSESNTVPDRSETFLEESPPTAGGSFSDFLEGSFLFSAGAVVPFQQLRREWEKYCFGCNLEPGTVDALCSQLEARGYEFDDEGNVRGLLSLTEGSAA